MSIRTAKDQLKKLYALPPYNTFSNVCAHDGIFANSISKEFSLEEINKANRELGYEKWKKNNA